MTKASILKKLLPFSGHKFIIDPFFSFTVEDWKNHPGRIVKKIKKQFGQQRIIVRSSAVFEDHHAEISPGEFHSQLNVNANSVTSVDTAIKKVISSYNRSQVARKNFFYNQVIIQRQLLNPRLNGVFDSSDWFYYMVEYSESAKATDDVTSGKQCRHVELFRHFNFANSSWSELINAAREVEKVLGWKSYQLEFAIDERNEVHIFQAKKVDKKNNPGVSLTEIVNTLKKASAFVNAKKNKRPLWSDMADWNPSEMLGELATPLQVSLYQYLITNKAWSSARQSVGYGKTASQKLITIIGGKPYVNVSLSFTSLLPADLSKPVAQKIVSIQLNQLRQQPELHDKVEFEILITFRELYKPAKEKKLLKLGLQGHELKLFVKKLDNLTQKIVKTYDQHYAEDIKLLNKLTIWRQKYFAVEKSKPNNIVEQIDMILNALKKCQQWGVIPFARQARYAFIAKEMFAGFSKLLTRREVNRFWSSFPTVTTELMEDITNMQDDPRSRKTFLKKFGHLRPGTYDIESKRYDSMSLYKLQEVHGFQASRERSLYKRPYLIESKMDNFLKQNAIPGWKACRLLSFIEQSTQMREYAKFQFSGVLSNTLESIAALGKALGFTRSEMQMITHQDLLVAREMANSSKIRSHWNNLIRERKRQYKIYKCIKYPALISSGVDFYINQTIAAKPNYTTSKIITGELIVIGKTFVLGDDSLENKIVCIPAADPGYDWIFTFNILGLVTKYGGAASHMAMRCVQFGIPAAIGCGDILFDKICTAGKIRLDCKRRNIGFLK